MKPASLLWMLGTFTGGMYAERLGGLTQAQRDVLNTMEVVYLGDCQGGPGFKTLRVKDANLQIVNGLGSTETTNGLGNLIVGYNEDTTWPCDNEGSHNLILGKNNGYHLYGSIVNGENNTVEDHAAVLGGIFSTAAYYGVTIAAEDSVSSQGAVIGGRYNSGSGLGVTIAGSRGVSNSQGAVMGGEYNTAIGWLSVALGGGNSAGPSLGNQATGPFSVVVGGQQNIAGGNHGTIVSGIRNTASGNNSCVTGGFENTANGNESVVSGGRGRVASNEDDWVAGSLFEDD
jgi:hypothetical protein